MHTRNIGNRMAMENDEFALRLQRTMENQLGRDQHPWQRQSLIFGLRSILLYLFHPLVVHVYGRHNRGKTIWKTTVENQNLHNAAMMLRQLRSSWENVHGEAPAFDSKVRVMTFFFFFRLVLGGFTTPLLQPFCRVEWVVLHSWPAHFHTRKVSTYYRVYLIMCPPPIGRLNNNHPIYSSFRGFEIRSFDDRKNVRNNDR